MNQVIVANLVALLKFGENMIYLVNRFNMVNLVIVNFLGILLNIVILVSMVNLDILVNMVIMVIQVVFIFYLNMA